MRRKKIWVEMYFEEKHRAEVAEEALRLMAIRCSESCIYGKGKADTPVEKQIGFYLQKAEARLAELKEEQNAKN